MKRLLISTLLGATALAGLCPAQDAPSADQVQVVTRSGGVGLEGRLTLRENDALLTAEGWSVTIELDDLLVVRSAERWYVPGAERAEVDLLRAAGRGDLQAAFKATNAWIRALVFAQQGGAISAAEAGAEVLVALGRLEASAEECGRVSEASQVFAAVANSRWFTPEARAIARTYYGWSLKQLGRRAEASRQEDALGTLRDFYVIGPFDNERGRGMGEAYGPQTEAFDPSASYPGKVAPLAWRATPSRESNGVVELDEILHPDEQGAAYALTYVHAERDTRAALRIGSSEAVTLWVNRVSRLDRRVRRSFSVDQDAVGVVLQKGWNEVLVKVGGQNRNWRFRLRATSPSGGALHGVRYATHAEIKQTQAFPKGVAPETELAQRAIAFQQARAQAFPNDPWAWFHLGYLHSVDDGSDATEHPDRDAFAKAVALRPDFGPFRVWHSYSLRGSAEFSVNEEHNARRQTLEEAVRRDPLAHDARVLLGDYYLLTLQNSDRARVILEPTVKAHPNYVDAQLSWVSLLEDIGRAPLARGHFRTLCDAAEDAVSNEEANSWPRQLLTAARERAKSAGNVRREQELLDQLVMLDRSDLSTLLRLAQLYEDQGNETVAGQLLLRACEGAPSAAFLRDSLAEFYVRRGDTARAEAALREALRLCPQDPQRLVRLGRFLINTQRMAPGRALLDQALSMDPKLVDLKKYLEFLDRKKKAVKGFEAEWVIEAGPLVKAAKATPLDKRRTHRILLRQEVDKVSTDGTKSSWRQDLIRVENREGARGLRAYGARYGSDQRIEVQVARLYRSAGGRVDVPVGTSSGSRRGEFGGSLNYSVRFPTLEPGDVIEVHYRVDDLRQGFFGDYYGRQVFFGDNVPLDRQRFVLIAPESRELYFHSPGARVGAPKESRKDGVVTRIWEKAGMAALEPEPNMPWLKEVVPQLQVSTFKDWDAFSRWYWGLVKGQHEIDDDLRAKVVELTRGAKSDEEKIRRIYDFVVTDVRYSAAWEFGVHGFKPYNATKILARRFGDCKDKATLIGTMLKVVGIQAHPVLIFGEDGRGAEDLSLPLMSHFNHCISYVDFEGGLFLDGTAEYHTYGTLPSMDYGAKVVVIQPEKALVKEIGFRGPEANGVVESHEVQLRKDGSGVVTGTLLGTGTFDVVLRTWLTNKGNRKEVLGPKIGRFYSGAKVVDVVAGDPVDLNTPFKVQVKTVIPKMLRPADSGGFELVEMRSWLFDMIYLRGGKVSGLAADSAARKHDVVLQVPSGVKEAFRYVLPPGYDLKSVPKPVKLETPFGVYERVYQRQADGSLKVQRVLQMRATRVPKGDYKAFRAFVESIDRAEQERPILRRAGGQQ